jgi:argininosuccinate lyase
MFRDATRAVRLVAAAMATAEFDAPRLEARAGDGWTTLTELADTLVRDHALPFKTAHAIASRLVGGRQREPQRSLAGLLKDATTELLGAPLPYSEEQLTRILSPRYFVEIRRTLGGPAPEETARAARMSQQLLDADETWWSQATDALAKAEQTLAARSAAL